MTPQEFQEHLLKSLRLFAETRSLLRTVVPTTDTCTKAPGEPFTYSCKPLVNLSDPESRERAITMTFCELFLREDQYLLQRLGPSTTSVTLPETSKSQHKAVFLNRRAITDLFTEIDLVHKREDLLSGLWGTRDGIEYRSVGGFGQEDVIPYGTAILSSGEIGRLFIDNYSVEHLETTEEGPRFLVSNRVYLDLTQPPRYTVISHPKS